MIITSSLLKMYNKCSIWKHGKFFRDDKKKYIMLNTHENFKIQKKYLYPVIWDRNVEAGNLGPYFWQDSWAARRISEQNPKEHYDIGSRIDGFIAMISLVIKKIILIDIRPLSYTLENVSFVCSDATSLEGINDDSIESLSALCSLEHFGLGRYGDPVDPDACFKAFESIQRVMKKGGRIYISVPIGKEHLEFNAHRIFYASTIVDAFDKMQLVEFSVTPRKQEKEMEINCDLHKYDFEDDNRGCRFGCFIFEKQ